MTPSVYFAISISPQIQTTISTCNSTSPFPFLHTANVFRSNSEHTAIPPLLLQLYLRKQQRDVESTPLSSFIFTCASTCPLPCLSPSRSIPMYCRFPDLTLYSCYNRQDIAMSFLKRDTHRRCSYRRRTGTSSSLSRSPAAGWLSFC